MLVACNSPKTTEPAPATETAEESVISEEDLPVYHARKATAAITIDGRLDEADWKAAPESSPFRDISGPGQPEPTRKSCFKALWDDENIYIAGIVEEPDVQSRLRQRDTIIWKENDFEVFLDPAGKGTGYFEIECNALGTVMDLMMSKPYSAGGDFYMPWDCPGLNLKTHIDGTRNNSADTDTGWTVEMSIPRKGLMWGFTDPASLKVWRANFSRVEWLRADKEENWVWSPTGKVDIHIPNLWGYIYFDE